MTQTDHNPLWLILTLIVLGVSIVLLSEIIKRDTQTDEENRGMISVTL